MRRTVLAGFAAVLCALVARPGTAQAGVISTSIDLDYTYSQERIGDDINATTQFNQKYEVKYETALTTSHDFLGAVRLDLQDAWHTDEAETSRIAPTLELGVKGSQLAAKLAYEEVKNSNGLFHESGAVTTYSTSVSFDFELTPALWPELRLKLQRRGDYQAEAKESVSKSFELQLRKDIYALRLEYDFKREGIDNVAPPRSTSTDNRWSAKATYKEIFWGGTEFELAYEINEDYKDDQSRGVFSGETMSYTQSLRTRVKNSLVLNPRMTLAASWEYQFDQDLLALTYDYKLKNKYLLELRWDTFDWFKITSEARRETDMTAAVVDAVEDDRSFTDGFRVGFDMTSIPWLRISGKAEFRNEGKIVAGNGGSVDRTNEEKYEIIAKNVIGDFWDLTLDGASTIERKDSWVTRRETKFKSDLKLKVIGWVITPGYEVIRTMNWDPDVVDPVSQALSRDARVKFEYQLQLLDLFKATFAHEYEVRTEDKLDEVLNFERVLTFSEDTRLNIAIAEIIRDLRLEGEIERRASDTEGDPDPELVEVSYALKLDWKYRDLSLLSSIKYNDKGDTFDDLSFNAKASWKLEHLELTAEYQFDKIIKEVTEPRDEKRKLNLKLNYKF